MDMKQKEYIVFLGDIHLKDFSIFEVDGQNYMASYYKDSYFENYSSRYSKGKIFRTMTKIIQKEDGNYYEAFTNLRVDVIDDEVLEDNSSLSGRCACSVSLPSGVGSYVYVYGKDLHIYHEDEEYHYLLNGLKNENFVRNYMYRIFHEGSDNYLREKVKVKKNKRKIRKQEFTKS